jgi:hypothetical protein
VNVCEKMVDEVKALRNRLQENKFSFLFVIFVTKNLIFFKKSMIFLPLTISPNILH